MQFNIYRTVQKPRGLVGHFIIGMLLSLAYYISNKFQKNMKQNVWSIILHENVCFHLGHLTHLFHTKVPFCANQVERCLEFTHILRKPFNCNLQCDLPVVTSTATLINILLWQSFMYVDEDMEFCCSVRLTFASGPLCVFEICV